MSFIVVLLLSLVAVSTSSNCNVNRLFDANIIMMSDGTASDSELLLNIPPEKDTAALRARCASFFRVRFGLEVEDALNEVGAPPANTTLIKFQTNFYSIYATSTSEGSQVPISNAYVLDHGYYVFVTAPRRLYGTWGGPSGKMVFPNHHVACGNYELFYDDGQQLYEPITFQSARPHFPSPVSTDALDLFNSNIWIECDLFSPQWGVGSAGGSINFRRLPDGRFSYLHRNAVTFPTRFHERTGPAQVRHCTPFSH